MGCSARPVRVLRMGRKDACGSRLYEPGKVVHGLGGTYYVFCGDHPTPSPGGGGEDFNRYTVVEGEHSRSCVTSRSEAIDIEFREFVTARSGALHRAAYLLTGNRSTAEDLVQTALIKTYLAWRRIGTIESLEAYTRRVLYNTNASWWRRRSASERPTESIPDTAGAPDRIEETVHRNLMWRYVKALPKRQRAVLVLRYYEDLSEADSAKVLGVSTGTIKSQTSRALGNLRSKMTADGLRATADVFSPVEAHAS